MTPKSSLSILSMIFPLSMCGSSANAPVSPVSSSTVNSPSIAPSLRSLSLRIARVIATPIPLSAPRVVPLAVSLSPSIVSGMGSFEKSCDTSLFFSHTMSMWLCRTIVGRSSIPGLAGLLMTTFSTLSVSYLRLCFLAKSMRYSLIFPSCFEQRGILLIASNSSQISWGLRFSVTVIIFLPPLKHDGVYLGHF